MKSTHFRKALGAAAAMTILGLLTSGLQAQRGGRGGGGVEGGAYQFSRLEVLANSFSLTKDQKKAVKTLLDDAHKAAAPTRDALASSHAAIATAIAANKGQAEIDAAVKQYAQQAAAMASLEMKALAQMLTQLDPEQRTNGAAVRTAFFLMRGIFLDDKKWDAVPDARSY
jgi:Spy/CpxP family protein refolding chaperone